MNLSVKIAGVTLKNPVTVASGTFGFGHEYAEFYDLSKLGAVSVKGLTYTRREGNRPPRIAETPMGLLNSIGLQNPGYKAFIENELPFLRQYNTKLIANISGNTVSEYAEMTEALCGAGVDLIELNVSCPNVKCGGATFGISTEGIESVVTASKKVATRPLIVKLTPNVTDIAEMARAAAGAGADAISLINTLLGMRIDVKTRRPVLGMNVGGLSGPAVKPVALRMVWQVAQAVDLPIIGMGGIMTAEDALEFLMAGATAVAVGTANLVDPMAPMKILDGISKYCTLNSRDVCDIIGSLEVNA
ncbi:MAG TPA: dihydroorotate dehydrogenase [Terriglobales bacterium]|nr:dihydroorotate dehydrogenase [Terriglobales bacterium]